MHRGDEIPMKQKLWFFPHLLALVLLSGCVTYMEAVTAEGSFERALQVSGAVNLDIRSGSGNIRVVPGSVGQVQIRGAIRVRRGTQADAEALVRELEQSPPIEQTGNDLRIGHFGTESDRYRNVSISYDVTVPAETRAQARTGSGDVAVQNLKGPVEARSGSGNVEISNIGDTVNAHTGSGNIRLASVQGAAVAQTGSGDIRAEGVAGAFTGKAGSGNVVVTQTAPGGATLQTGSGNITASGLEGPLQAQTGSGSIKAEGQPSANWNLRAGSGDVSLSVPATAAFDFDAHTGSGSISIDHPMTVQGKIERRRVQGKVRGGGALVSVQTGSGAVRVN